MYALRPFAALLPLFLVSKTHHVSAYMHSSSPRCSASKPTRSTTSSSHTHSESPSTRLLDRRSALPLVGALPFLTVSAPVTAADVPVGAKPTEFRNVGTQAPPPEGESPFRTLDSGVKVKDFRLGQSDGSEVKKGTKVSLQLTGRLLNLNGVVFYDSKKNDPDGFGSGLDLTFVVGEGKAIPGLEEGRFDTRSYTLLTLGYIVCCLFSVVSGMNRLTAFSENIYRSTRLGVLGMKKGGIRRIIVPPALGYDTTKPELLEPVPFTAETMRALDSVIRNSRRDSTLLFDVKLERLK